MKNLVIIILAIFFAANVNAQTEVISNTGAVAVGENTTKGVVKVDAFGEIVDKKDIEIKGEVKTAVPGFHRTAKPIAVDFTGYTIQMKVSNRELAVDDKLYKEFGSVMVHEMLNPNFVYYVGQFKSQEGAEKYLNTIIASRYPEAVVVKYVAGRRISK